MEITQLTSQLKSDIISGAFGLVIGACLTNLLFLAETQPPEKRLEVRVFYVTNTVTTIREMPAPSQSFTAIHPILEHMPMMDANIIWHNALTTNDLVYTNGTITIVPNGGAR